MKFAKVALRKIRPCAVGDKYCLLPTAEVLTEKGWISLQDIDITNTKVATMDPTTHNLDYVLPTDKHVFDYDSKTDGKMYYVKTKSMHIVCTPNHKLYTKKTDAHPFGFKLASETFGIRSRFKKNVNNCYPTSDFIRLKDKHGVYHRYPIKAYLKLLGMFISDGYTSDYQIKLCMRKQRKLDFIRSLEPELGFTFNYNEVRFVKVGVRKAKGIFEEFQRLSVGAINKRLPSYIWKLGKDNCEALLEGLMNGDGSLSKTGTYVYSSSSPGLIDDIQRLIFHCGYVGNIQLSQKAGLVSQARQPDGSVREIKTNHDNYKVVVNKRELEPVIKDKVDRTIDEKWIDYKGQVMCIEVPETHLFYYRENRCSPPCWSGNSSRSGQKGICSLLMREADMPSTLDGIRPTLLFNSHGIPSRMTVAQLVESLLGNLCAIKGAHTDGTMFKDVDIESISAELEQYGMHRYGYERMISGLTGEFIDTEVFFGPTFYQRLICSLSICSGVIYQMLVCKIYLHATHPNSEEFSIDRCKSI